MTKTVLFICLHGSAKSVIAAQHFNRLAATRGLVLDAETAGTEPDAEIPDAVVRGLLADGFDLRGRVPRAVTRHDLEHAFQVVSFGCDVSALTPMGRVVDQWEDLPLVSDGYEPARDAIVDRVARLLDRLVTDAVAS